MQAWGTPIPSDCFHFFCSELLNSTRFYSHSRPRRSIIQRNLWWRHNGAVRGPFQCINCSQPRNIWVDGTFEARSEDCPTGHCASEMINKCSSLIHLMVVTTRGLMGELFQESMKDVTRSGWCHYVTMHSATTPRLHCSSGMSPDFIQQYIQHSKHIIIICR